MANLYGGTVYHSLEDLLDADINAVSVCVRNEAHYTVTIRALERGKHVLCEKPMAMTAEDCRAMVDFAESKKLNLMIGLNQRYMAVHQKAKELIGQGEIGKILSFEVNFCHAGPDAWTNSTDTWFFDKEKAVFGAMADLGVHKIDLISYLLDSKIIETYAVMETLDKKFSDGTPSTVEDNAFCIYKMENGVIGTMHAGWTYYGGVDGKTIIHGTKGVIQIYADPNANLVIKYKDSTKRTFNLENTQCVDEKSGITYQNSGVIDEFIASIIENRKPHSDGNSSLEAMNVIFANNLSNRIHQPVKVNQ